MLQNKSLFVTYTCTCIYIYSIQWYRHTVCTLHTHMHTRTHAHTHARTPARTPHTTYTHYSHTHTHVCTHTHTHYTLHIHTHSHTNKHIHISYGWILYAKYLANSEKQLKSSIFTYLWWQSIKDALNYKKRCEILDNFWHIKFNLLQACP